jgi:4-hydroxy-tetrahydrodipicolinate reductase
MKIALIGYGKMGKAIEAVAIKKGHHVVLKIDLDNLDELNAANLSKADAAIEFTGPGSAFGNVMKCLQAGIPLVCGSTGWLENFETAKKYCLEKDGTLLYASNFSIGVNIFFEVNRLLARLMESRPEYEVTMTEIHHTQKKDAPSGTAITLAEQIIERIPRKKLWVNHISDNPEELEIISERIDPAPGTHKIRYGSPVDDIEITHTAHSREGFAQGAVLAAEYIHNKKGLFSMKEVLGF